jgi:hypothetical protein
VNEPNESRKQSHNQHRQAREVGPRPGLRVTLGFMIDETLPLIADRFSLHAQLPHPQLETTILAASTNRDPT